MRHEGQAGLEMNEDQADEDPEGSEFLFPPGAWGAFGIGLKPHPDFVNEDSLFIDDVPHDRPDKSGAACYFPAFAEAGFPRETTHVPIVVRWPAKSSATTRSSTGWPPDDGWLPGARRILHQFFMIPE
jgi:hypothetical protein